MKKLSFLFVAFTAFLMVGNTAFAQDDEISNEDLRRYALMMEVIDAMKDEVSAVTNDMIRNQDGIDGRRFTEVSKGDGDAATDFETKFVNMVNEMKDDRIDAIKEVNQILATKMLPDGGKKYKAIKSALASDDAVKARYEKIAAQMKLKEGDA